MVVSAARPAHRGLPFSALLLLLLCGAGCAADGPASWEDPCAGAEVPYPEEVTPTGDVRFVHDPEIVRDGTDYYILSTNDGIPIRRSTDLLEWTFAGRVFPDGLPAWAIDEVPGVQDAWAPGVAFFNGRYHLYYSLSTFGSPRSVIGLATNATLDPDAPGYRWQDRGKVLESFAGDDFNAIDAAVAEDGNGGLWLAWGSWGGGIRMRALDRETGLLSTSDDSVHALAGRPVQQALEGPYIIRRGGFFYLFVSFDLCCRGVESTYSVRVGRSTDVTGPYLDRDGTPMLQGGGSRVLTGYGRISGPGHNSVLAAQDAWFLVHHFYDGADNGVPRLQIRPLLWDEQGWPLAGFAWDGSPVGPPPPSPSLAGQWGYWAGDDQARAIELRADGTVLACDGAGRWSWDAPVLSVEWSAGTRGGARTDQSLLSKDAAAFVGRTPDGTIVRGFRLPPGRH